MKTKPQTKQEGRKVHLMPAAVNSMPLNEFLGVKYGAPKNNKPFTAERRLGLYTMYLPDRTLYIGRGNSSVLGVTNVDLDAYFNLSPLSNPETLKSMGIEFMMVTPERLAGSDYVRRNGVVKVVSDSGGFQLSQGVTDFIEPDHLAKFYKSKVDFGIGLDIPVPRHLQSSELFMRMAKVMILNNKYITERLKGSPAEIYDVSHGLTLPNRKRFTEYVLANQVSENLALGGIGQASYGSKQSTRVMEVLNTAFTLDLTKGQYKRYHVLGTTNTFMLTIYHLLTELDVAPFITCDSSSHAQGGLAFSARGMIYSPTNNAIPTFTVDAAPISYGMPCNCQVCALSGYPHIYRMSQTANSLHTMYLYEKLTVIAGEYARMLLSGKNVMPELLHFVSPNKSMHSTYRALYKFVLDLDKGFDKAWSKHKETLSYLLRKDTGSTGLFGKSDSLTPKMVKVTDNITKAIVRYEKFHGLDKSTKQSTVKNSKGKA
jgi:hypothetical protein